MSENLNMSVRKFLKEVGVTSQQIIEKEWYKKNFPSDRKIQVEMTLIIKDLDIKHIVSGEIGGA